MSYPGDQAITPADQWWRYESGQHAYVPAQAGFDVAPPELVPANGGYAASAPSGQAATTGPGYAARTGNGQAEQSGAGYAPRPRAGYAPQPGNGYRPARPGPGPAAAAVRAGRSPRDPARGYPPLPGDPGPRYPQREFSAWNEPAVPAPRAPEDLPFSAPTWSDVSSAFDEPVPAPRAPEDLPFSAPTWSDVSSAFDEPGPGPGGHGVALAERAGDDLADFSADDLAAWDASLADELTGAPGQPSPPAAPAGTAALDDSPAALPEPALAAGPSPDDGIGRPSRQAARRTRAAAARTRKTARRKVRARRRVVIAGVSLPAIAVVAVMAFQHPGGHPQAARSAPATHTASAASAGSPAGAAAPGLGTWQHIGTRAGDPAALTLGQLFPAQFTAGGASYVRTAQLGSADCSRGVFGGQLQAAVRRHGCTQVMRASYLDSAQKLMGTIGVLDLANAADAGKVGRVTGASQFIAQLTAPTGPTRTLTRGTGLEEAQIKGHYLILTWAEFTTHRAPATAAQRAQLKAFSAYLVSQTANVSLTSRMVTGAP
jgi:hypothetical protein